MDPCISVLLDMACRVRLSIRNHPNMARPGERSPHDRHRHIRIHRPRVTDCCFITSYQLSRHFHRSSENDSIRATLFGESLEHEYSGKRLARNRKLLPKL